ncbi:MAG: hypothetical protein M0P91_10160 [Sulfuricurvum sp.]|jgi:hypothetical protein|uniref:hypothetical protein n=1 Tax=Sulfuricurvum sp. TaxID=2025608 RepID=UPI0025ED5B30|nr:hypothetical protein [Sulfuricurvum sp.]MCK9373551.1 hypothetical protein [Sulfuricurvum sp.]
MTNYEQLKAKKMESTTFKRFYDLAMGRKKRGLTVSNRKVGRVLTPKNPPLSDQLKAV